MSRRRLTTLLIFLLFGPAAIAQIPNTLSYQGVATDEDGTPLNGDQAITLRLYDVETGGEALWEELHVVAVSNGVFNLVLGSITPLDLPFDKPYWLGITIGTGTELSPRTPLTSSAYSLNASTVADGSITPEKLAPGLSLPPGGQAGGDLEGDFPNPTVTRIRNQPLAQTTPDSGEILKWDGSQWVPEPDGSEWHPLFTDIADLGYNGDAAIGGGADSFDLSAEYLAVRGQSKTWYLGVENEAASDRGLFFISQSNFDDGSFRLYENGYLFIPRLQIKHPGSGFGLILESDDLERGWGWRTDPSTGRLLLAEGIFGDGGNSSTINHFSFSREGRIGVGTSAPTHELHVIHASTSGGGATAGIKIENVGSNHNWWALYTANGSAQLELYYKGTLKGRFISSDGTYQKTSDRRLKRNIRSLSPVLDRVMQLNPSSYSFRDNPDPTKRSMGFLAQEVEPLFPELVGRGGDGQDLMTLNYDGFSVLAVKAIQEQQQRIEQLMERIEILENMIK